MSFFVILFCNHQRTPQQVANERGYTIIAEYLRGEVSRTLLAVDLFLSLDLSCAWYSFCTDYVLLYPYFYKRPTGSHNPDFSSLYKYKFPTQILQA